MKRSPAEILDAIGKAPALKWSAVTEIKKLGLMAWSDNQHLAELVSKIRHCMESKEYRSAGIGCLYLFGAGKSEDAIELSEKAFESIESSADYEFHDYLACCERGGQGNLSSLYADFGDVREEDFRKWWTTCDHGAELFAEQPREIRQRQLMSKDEWDDSWSPSEAAVFVFLDCPRSRRHSHLGGISPEAFETAAA